MPSLYPHAAGLGWPGEVRARLKRAGRWLRGALVAACLMLGAVQAWDSPRVLQQAGRMGPGTAARAQMLIQEIAEAAGQPEVARLRAINAFFNRQVLYADDREVWGQVDYWASPLETLAKARGDCEDYAIGKYFSLLAAGVPGVKMRLVYVRADMGGAVQAHMVLAYYPEPDAEPLILDNLVTDIRPASRRPDLTPVFSFNAEGLWQGVGTTTAGDPTARLSRWRDALMKARSEGWW
ncbi:transglutaminase-like cysteine peptidase [Aquabacterium fontiphilum]|jgi:predicted transglutaminase-like cysteine proteinase|uniref:transglutaminase-like cysteine peptidase n=1 Tax=Aquabacterium fontiphilum TaxID=450365 RepID=UPI001F214355|nr:transglutaminase-like cysteine peptidase [Aquabacterium fontiphilum]